MSPSTTANNANPGQPGQDATTTIGVGGATSGANGATPSHETQRETGGSGGEQLTASQGESAAPATAPNVGPDTSPVTPSDTALATPRDAAEPAETSMHSGARGAPDTRSAQAGGTGTGLGAPESGANQAPDDLAPPSGAAAPKPR